MESWRRARLIAYCAVKPHIEKNISVFEFLPLPGDPTDEQMAESRRQYIDVENDRARQILKAYKEQKLLT